MAEGTPIIIKKKKIVAGGHHGGSWKVAYADFVTAMMAFFMVMWIMGMDTETRSMIAGYFNDPFGVLKSTPKTNTPFALPGSPRPKDINGSGSGGGDGDSVGDRQRESTELGELRAKIEKDLEEEMASHPEFKALMENLETKVTSEGLLIEFSEAAGSVFFESGSDIIRPEARALIAQVAPVLAKSGRLIDVQGHTDAEPYSSGGYTNWDLSTWRALSMQRLLMRCGMQESQFNKIEGCADKFLKVPERPFDFKNRRVSVLLKYRTADNVKFDLPGEGITPDVQGAFTDSVIVPDGKKNAFGEAAQH